MMAQSRTLSAELEFLRLLWTVEHGLQKTSKQMARDFGLTGPQRLALWLVSRFPAIERGQLAHLMRLHPSTITGVLMRLERRALVERRADTHDRRRTHLFATAAGRRLNTPSTGTVESVVSRVLARIGPRRRLAAEAVLTQLADALPAPAKRVRG